MSKILRISESDYRIKVKDNGNITLDTGSNTGVVTITGNLVVQGDYTTVNVQDMQVEDNIIVLNKGETGNGVTEGSAGLEIARGTLSNAQFLWDESVDKFTLQLANNSLVGIVVDSIATDPTQNLKVDMQSGGGTIRIINSSGYESRVVDDNDVPNKKYVNDYVYASGGSAKVSLVAYPVSAPYGLADSMIEALASSIKFYVRAGGFLTQRAQLTANGLDVNNVNILNDTILNSAGNNLVLTSTNNNVEIDGVLNLLDQASAPTATGGTTRIYAKTQAGSGRSALYVTNSSLTNIETWDPATSTYVTGRDELIVKNRALLFSMLF